VLAVNLMKKEARKLLTNMFFLFLIILLLVVLATARPNFDPTFVGQTYSVSEDTPFLFNFSAIVQNPEPPMTYTIISVNISTNPDLTQPSDFPWVQLDSLTGILTIDSTTDIDTGVLEILANVANETSGTSDIFLFNVTPVNDPPEFTNLENKEFNMTEIFQYLIQATDEENNFPVVFNISFLNCTVAPWSTRDCSTQAGRELFTASDYITDGNFGEINISFTPSRNDVGVYEINFSVSDSGNTIQPFNAQRSQIVNFTVLNQNAAPFFTYICDNERNATEDTPVSCDINATDIDEINDLTFGSDLSWFTFSASGTNIATIPSGSPNDFDFTALTGFTPTDEQVGDWIINLTVRDNSDLPIKVNTTLISFTVANINDSVLIEPIQDIVVYTTNTGFVYVNATDDDLLIPDKTIYDESISFSADNPNLNLVSVSPTAEPNKLQALFSFNPNDLNVGINTVTITASDSNLFSSSQTVFNIDIQINSAPVWSAFQNSFNLAEDSAFLFNLSQHVTDADGDIITFTSSSSNEFPSFSLDTATGMVDFTPIDEDVGQHVVTINATDGKTPTPVDLTFTISNINDIPTIQSFPSSPSANFSGDILNGFSVMEDASVVLTLWVHDDDFKIPAAQKSFYGEDITINLSIQNGPNPNLFNFALTNDFSSPNNPQSSVPERLEFDAVFTPLKQDIGVYNITLNISDQSGINDSIEFTLNVTEIQHNPKITPIGNINTSIVETLFIDVNSTDLEDIDENFSGSNLSYSLLNLSESGNFLTIDSSTGIISFPLTQAQAGRWEYEVSVTDSSGLTGSEIFNISVYDFPNIILPLSGPDFFLAENKTTPFVIAASQTVPENLTYAFSIGGVEKDAIQENGGGTQFTFNLTPDFSSETTCSGAVMLELIVSNPKLNSTRSWNVEVNQTNFPLEFVNNIGNQVGGSPITISLSPHFLDFDASDGCINQTIGFSATLLNSSGGTISVEKTDWENSASSPEIVFSSTTDSTGTYSIRALEYFLTNYAQPVLSTVLSNNFTVEISSPTPPPPVTVPVPTSGGGGGGGSSSTKTVSLDIIVPPPMTAEQIDALSVPVKLLNNGQTDLTTITLSAEVTKNEEPINDFGVSFDETSISSLPIGVEKELTMTVDIATEKKGLFKIKITADVSSPTHTATEDFFVEIKNETDIIERIIFTEELIVNNPECTELQELINEARSLVDQNDIEGARQKTEEAVEACRDAIVQPVTSRVKKRVEERLFGVVTASSLIALILGLGYYSYRKVKLKKELNSMPTPKLTDKRTTFNNYQSYST